MRKVIVKMRDGEAEGFFHGLFPVGDLTNGVEPYAVVEFVTGTLGYFPVDCIMFVTQETAVDKAEGRTER